MDVTLTAYDAAQTSYSLVSASRPWKLTQWDWGNAVWDQAFSGPRGTLGARATFSQVANRQVAVGLRLVPASKSAVPGHLSDLAAVMEAMRRYGGRVTVTTASVTYRQHLEVLAGSATLQNWTHRTEWSGRVDYALGFVAEPYVRGDAMGYTDTLQSSPTTADWTFDAGAAGDISVSNGEWVPASAGIATVLVHSRYGYSYGDVRVAVTCNPSSTITNQKAGVVLKRTGATTRIECYVDDNGANSRLRIDKVVAGVPTNLASVNLGARIAAGFPFRVVGSIEGDTVRAKVWTSFLQSEQFDRSADASTSTVLSTTDAATFGHNVTGQVGIAWTPRNTDGALDDFTVQPYAYDVSDPAGHIPMCGAIPGDAPALVELEVVASAGVFPTPKASVIAFGPRPANRNYLSDGSFDVGVSGNVARPWTVAGVTGITGAATSIQYGTPGRWGAAHAQVVTPASSGVGAACAVYGPFIAGITYRASVWVKATAGTTTTRLIFGVSGSTAASAGVALSSTWTQKTVDWTPTTTTYVAYIAVEQTAATATTWQMDAAEVYEVGRQPTALVTQTRGRGGRPPAALLSPQEAYSLTTFTETTAGGGYPVLTGSVLQVASSASAAVARWRLDPALLDPSHHTASAEMEVWVWAVAPVTTWTSPKLIASLQGGDAAQPTYTREYGSTGYTPTGGGLHRLGTLAIPLTDNGQVDLVLRATCSAMTGNLQIPWVLLVPPHRRIVAPQSPGLMPVITSGSTSAVQIKEDGLSRVRTFTEPGWSAAPGVGQTLTIDVGECELLYAMMGTSATSHPFLNLLRVTPTPRWHHLRDA